LNGHFFIWADRQFSLPNACQIGLGNSAGAKKKAENQKKLRIFFHGFSSWVAVSPPD
jgi:hypothetical protein